MQCKVDAWLPTRCARPFPQMYSWFSRIILPAVANGLGRTGQLYADSNSQMIITDGGNAYRSTGTPDGKAVAGTIIGGMGEQGVSWPTMQPACRLSRLRLTVTNS